MNIELKQLHGGYSDVSIIENVNFNIREGEWLTIVGANGSGKSTLLKLINRILIPQKGSVFFDQQSCQSMSPKDIAQQISFLAQQQHIPENITVQELVSLGRVPHQTWWQWSPSPEDQEHIQWAIAKTGLETYRDRPVQALSGGERQRVFIALALAQRTQALLLDEPTSYLDIHYQLELLELLKSLQTAETFTIVTVLHDLNLAERYSDRVALMQAGQVLSVGKRHEVLTQENIRQAFQIEAEILLSSIGRIIVPLNPCGQIQL